MAWATQADKLKTERKRRIKEGKTGKLDEAAFVATDPYEIKNLVSDTALTSKLDAELEQLMKTVNYTAPSNANKARQPVPTKPNVIIILADDLLPPTSEKRKTSG